MIETYPDMFASVPRERAREGYAKMMSELVAYFTLPENSGHAIVHFKEGVPMAVEPSPRISLK